MNRVSRRDFVKGAGAIAALAGAASAGAGVVTALQAEPAGAVSGDDGLVFDQGGQVFNIKNSTYGALGNGTVQTNALITAGSQYFIRNDGGTFYTSDVGKIIVIEGAGPSNGTFNNWLATTIIAWVSTDEVELGAASSQTLLGGNWFYGTDDTAAIVAAVNAASAVNGVVFAPPGMYMISGAKNPNKANSPIDFTGTAGLIGCGSEQTDTGTPGSTTFVCGDANAGFLAQGSGTYEGFMVNGATVANTPMQNGAVVNGSATTVSSNATFRQIKVFYAAQSGWAIYGAQNNSYYDIQVAGSLQDGLYVDGGSRGLEFWNWQESVNLRYGVHGDELVPLNGVTGTSNVRFYAGLFDAGACGPKIYLRGATNWCFREMNIDSAGINTTTYPIGQGIDLSQTSGYGIDFTGTNFLHAAHNGGASPGYPCILVNDAPGTTNNYTFLVTDRAWFVTGDTSIYFEQPATASGHTYNHAARGWMFDGSGNGPLSATGPSADVLLAGRTSPWHKASVGGNWNSLEAIYYRIDEDGFVRLQGSVNNFSGSAGTIFTLPAGYWPPSDVQIPAYVSTGLGCVTVSSTTGAVAGSNVGLFGSIDLDGVTFAVSQ